MVSVWTITTNGKECPFRGVCDMSVHVLNIDYIVCVCVCVCVVCVCVCVCVYVCVIY